MIVDHANPLHDGFCRCRRCKPSPVGTTSQSFARLRVMLLIAMIATVGMFAVQQLHR